jgi:glycerol-3-phosphate acyltransferase PlsY
VPSVLPSFDWSFLLSCAAALAFGYLCGSIPFGPILTRLAGTQDLRSIGSGNIGATNVLRAGHKRLAAATLLGDMLKGTAAVLLARYWWGRELALIAGLGAFLGHLFPIWLGLKGGKGVATYIGVLLALAWPAALVFAFVWLAVAAVTRYSSLAALIASATTPPALWLLDHRPEAQLFAALTVLLWVMHRANIARLCNGTEGKIRILPSAQARSARD